MTLHARPLKVLATGNDAAEFQAVRYKAIWQLAEMSYALTLLVGTSSARRAINWATEGFVLPRRISPSMRTGRLVGADCEILIPPGYVRTFSGCTMFAAASFQRALAASSSRMAYQRSTSVRFLYLFQ